MAHEAAARADLVLFVTDSDLNEVEYSALVELAASHKPICWCSTRPTCTRRRSWPS